MSSGLGDFAGADCESEERVHGARSAITAQMLVVIRDAVRRDIPANYTERALRPILLLRDLSGLLWHEAAIVMHLRRRRHAVRYQFAAIRSIISILTMLLNVDAGQNGESLKGG